MIEAAPYLRPVRRLLLALVIGALASCGGCRDESRVLVLAFDGMDPATLDLMLSEGKLPAFARLRQEGAYGRLRSMKPLLSPILWTTIATGTTPDKHGIGHFVVENDRTGERLPVTSRTRRTKALWNLFSEADRSVAVVGWWATWPAEPVNGSIVSDHVAYHFLFEGGFTGGEGDEGKTHPPELFERIAPLVRRPDDLDYDRLRDYVSVGRADLARPFDFEEDLGHFRWALATALSYRDIGLELWNEDDPDLELVYIEGTDSSAHLFGHLFRRDDLAGELAEQAERYGQTVEAMYELADRILARYLEAIDDDTTLVVLSDHGFQLGALPDDPSTTRNLRRVSAQYHREEGILYLYGKHVKRHARIDRPSILDITPTVLALAGLSPARDMPGRVLTEALDLDVPERTVDSYEDGERTEPEVAPTDPGVEQQMLAHLEALGYVETHSREGDTNMASIHFEAGRYAEAEALYRKVLAEDPDNPALHTSLAGTLGAMGRYAEARAELERALELEPLNPEAHHNLAVIAERLGDAPRAIEGYRTALKYAPQYEPSREALIRLTGSADVQAPRTEGERLASILAERAAQAARRGAYDEAMEQLDEAERLAPAFPLVFQYRANVAYLQGDHAEAIRALERGLELDPTNELFRQNLEQIRALAAAAEPSPPPTP